MTWLHLPRQPHLSMLSPHFFHSSQQWVISRSGLRWKDSEGPTSNMGADLRHYFWLSTPAIMLASNFHLPDSYIHLLTGPELGKGGTSQTVFITSRMRATESHLSPHYWVHSLAKAGSSIPRSTHCPPPSSKAA